MKLDPKALWETLRTRLAVLGKLKGTLRYVVLGVVAFVIFLFFTFPYDVIAQRLEVEARRNGFGLKIRSLGPSLFGVHAKGLLVSKLAGDGPDAKESDPLQIDSLTLRPTLFPPGISASSDLCGGHVNVTAGGTGDASIHVALRGLDLSKGNLKGFSGVDMEGVLDGMLALELPATAPGAGGRKEPNLGEASGSATLNLHQMTIKGGTVTVPMYGTPTPMDLPRLSLGNLDGDVKFDKGQGTIDTLTASGGDLDLKVTGTLHLAPRIEYAEQNLVVKLKPSPELMKNGFIGMGISALPPVSGEPGYRGARIMGSVGRPSFQPGT